MTTRSEFIAWIADLTSGVKWSLNASSTSISYFLSNTGCLLLQSICKQSPVISVVIHPLNWCMTLSPIGSCFLGIVFWLNVTLWWWFHVVWQNCQHYSHLHLFTAWCSLWGQILPHCHQQCIWVANQNAVAFHQHCLFGLVGNYLLCEVQSCFWSARTFWATKWFSYRIDIRKFLFLSFLTSEIFLGDAELSCCFTLVCIRKLSLMETRETAHHWLCDFCELASVTCIVSKSARKSAVSTIQGKKTVIHVSYATNFYV